VGAWQEEQEDLMLAETDDEALEAALRVEAVRVRPQSTRLTCGASFGVSRGAVFRSQFAGTKEASSGRGNRRM